MENDSFWQMMENQVRSKMFRVRILTIHQIELLDRNIESDQVKRSIFDLAKDLFVIGKLVQPTVNLHRQKLFPTEN